MKKNRTQTTRSAGQVMVLSCITLFVLAMMVMSGFSLSNAIHERIRIQSHADSAAYSSAVIAARALNVTAYTNRTIAAVLVTQMSVHAWMAIASETAMIHMAGAVNFGRMAACEMDSSHCCSIRCYGVCCNVPHCIHAAIDGIIAAMHAIKMMEWSQKVQGKESDFNDVVEKLNQATIDLHKLQKASLEKAKEEISAPSSVLNALKARNAPKSAYVDAVFKHNGGEFACVLEGSDFDDDCEKVTGAKPSKIDQGERSKVMQSAANAARLQFHVMCSDCTESASDKFQSGSDHLMDTQWNDDDESHNFDSMSGVSSGAPMPPMGPAEAKAVGSITFGKMKNEKFCTECSATTPLFTTIWSDEGGGMHLVLGHSGSHDKFKGYQQQDVCGDEACFINYRASSDKESDFNQPSMYAAVSQDLGTMRHGGRGKWEINNAATIKVNFGDQTKTDFKLKPRGTGRAVAKAKVYYHELGKWQNQPNLFDPFWRAKLHPFKREEFKKILEDAEDTEGATIAGNGPVEGDQR